MSDTKRYSRKKKTPAEASGDMLLDAGDNQFSAFDDAPAPSDDRVSGSFKDNYVALEKIVSKLQSGTVEDIDNLIPLVEEATRAYNGCKDRIDAVEKMINKTLE